MALASICFPATLCAQKEFEKDNRGDWSVTLPVNPKLTGDLTLAERAETTAWVNAVLEMFHKMPLLADPRGFRVMVYVRAHPDNLDDNTIAGRATHVSGFVQLNLASYEKTENGVVPVQSDSAASIQIAVNDLVPVFGASLMQTGSAQTADFRLGIPKPDGTIHGYPVYDRWVVIQKNDTPLFAPVTRGDFLKYELKKAEAGLAEMQKLAANSPQQPAETHGEGAPGTPEQSHAALDAQASVVQQLKQQSAELSADDSNLPATLADTDENGAAQFSSPDDASATPVVTFNPALFASSASRSAPRIWRSNSIRTTPIGLDVLRTIDDQFDWHRLQSLLQ